MTPYFRTNKLTTVLEALTHEFTLARETLDLTYPRDTVYVDATKGRQDIGGIVLLNLRATTMYYVSLVYNSTTGVISAAMLYQPQVHMCAHSNCVVETLRRVVGSTQIASVMFPVILPKNCYYRILHILKSRISRPQAVAHIPILRLFTKEMLRTYITSYHTILLGRASDGYTFDRLKRKAAAERQAVNPARD
jgi:hypothetical protein